MPCEILIVNDEPNLRLSTAQIMREAGYAVATAASDREALSLIQAGHFDLVFLDIRLLARGEASLIPEIQSKYPGIRLLVFSPFREIESQGNGIEKKRIRYLVKPVEPVEILSAVHCLLSGEN